MKVSTVLTNLRSQCVSYCILMITQGWIYDDNIWVRNMKTTYSPITQFLMKGKVPRGFINEVLNRAALNQDLLEEVSNQYLSKFFSINCNFSFFF